MSVYNSYYDNRTRTTISQAIDEDGRYCVLFQRGVRTETTACRGADHQYEVFMRNVRWYRGY